MKNKIAFPLAFIFLFLIMPVKTYASEVPSVNAEAALIMDMNTGQVLYSKNPNEKLAPASTTKIITALITLEKCNLNDIVTIGKDPQLEDGNRLYLVEGEKISVKDLLYGMLLESANDAALALAEHISGSKAAFAELMNEKARELGCTDTNFVNPNGLYDPNHYTSALDLAIIAKAAMDNPVFREIVSTTHYQIQPTNMYPKVRDVYTINRLLRSSKYMYEGADGVKSGYTTKSKNTLVASATRGNRRLLVVELKSTKDLYEDAIKLLDYGFSNFSDEKIISKDEAVDYINIKGYAKPIPVYPNKDLYITVQGDQTPSFTKDIVLNKSFKSISKGDNVGYIEVTLDNNKIKIPLISENSYSSVLYSLNSVKSGLYDKTIKATIKKIIIFSIAAAVFAILVILRINKVRKKKRNRLFAAQNGAKMRINQKKSYSDKISKL